MSSAEDDNSNEIVDILSVSPRKSPRKAAKITESVQKITSFESLLDVVSSELKKSDSVAYGNTISAENPLGSGRRPKNYQEKLYNESAATDQSGEDYLDCFQGYSPTKAISRDDDELSISSGISSGNLRKDKSLGLLCNRFLTCMKEQSANGKAIHLETTAQNLQVEKRRIYDIVNVMEALEAMKKQTKSYYSWSGLDHLPHLMFQLKEEAMAEKLPAKIVEVEKAMCTFTELLQRRRVVAAKKREKPILSGGKVGTSISQDSGYSSSGSQESLNQTPEIEEDDLFRLPDGPILIQVIDEDEELKGIGEKRLMGDKGKITDFNSLSLLCRRFLMLLLCAPTNGKVSLDVASTMLVKDPEAKKFEPPSRSKCRRLYDIANVLVAMNLIKKVHYLFGTKKIPLFVYCGPDPIEDKEGKFVKCKSETMLPSPSLEKENSPKKSAFRRHSSLMEMCEVAMRERERLHKGSDDETKKAVANLEGLGEPEEEPLNLVLKDQMSLSATPEFDQSISTPFQLPKSDYRVNSFGFLLKPDPDASSPLFPAKVIPDKPRIERPIVRRPIPSTIQGHNGGLVRPVSITGQGVTDAIGFSPARQLLPVHLVRAATGQLYVQSRANMAMQYPRAPPLFYSTTALGPVLRPPHSLQSVWSTGFVATGADTGPFYSRAGSRHAVPQGLVPTQTPAGNLHRLEKSPQAPKKRFLEQAVGNPAAKRVRVAGNSPANFSRKSVIIPSILKQNQPIGEAGNGSFARVLTEPLNGDMSSAFTSIKSLRTNLIKSPGKVL